MNPAGDAALVASLFAVDPAGTGGVSLRSLMHPARDQWLRLLRDLLPADAPMRRMPFNIPNGRLLGGLDLTATIKCNRPIAERGVLAATDRGVVVVSMAERLTLHTAACINSVLDVGEVTLPREGVHLQSPARVGIVALDEGMSDEESVPAALLDRLAFLLDFNGFSAKTLIIAEHDGEDILAARSLLPRVHTDPQILAAICGTALALGAGSPRVSLLALRVARASAALDGRVDMREEDAILAARLVLAPRATIAPPQQQEIPPTPPQDPQTAQQRGQGQPPDGGSDPSADAPDPPPRENADGSRDASTQHQPNDLDNIVLTATRTSMPSGLLAKLQAAEGSRLQRSAVAGRAGALRNSRSRGRPCGVRSGSPRGHERLNVIETLRAAAPWQRLRGRNAQQNSRIVISPDDFRVTRYRQRTPTLTIFAVDASGSSALHRLAEAKGAVELLLADCYLRRDQVAVIAFRRRSAEVLLPPTRSLTRAKRSLAELAGGGGTPLAAAIEIAALLAGQSRRRGETPTIVMLTDGAANVARDGSGGREAAQAQALRAAAAVGNSRFASLFVDTSPRPNSLTRDLALAMHAHYVPLPMADSRALSNIVKSTAAAAEHSAPRR
jgi:magnesium chelatase subunit D